MKSWWKVSMPIEESGLNGRAQILKDQFARVFIANGGPAQAAMFCGSDDEFQYHITYFSPEAFQIASNLIDRYRPTACEPPRHDKVKLAVGHSGLVKTILPGKEAA